MDGIIAPEFPSLGVTQFITIHLVISIWQEQGKLIFLYTFFCICLLFFCCQFYMYVFYWCYVSYSKQHLLYKTCILHVTCIFRFTPPVVTGNDRCYCRNMYLKLKRVVTFYKFKNNLQTSLIIDLKNLANLQVPRLCINPKYLLMSFC